MFWGCPMKINTCPYPNKNEVPRNEEINDLALLHWHTLAGS